jgi:hypothetical protein
MISGSRSSTAAEALKASSQPAQWHINRSQCASPFVGINDTLSPAKRLLGPMAECYFVVRSRAVAAMPPLMAVPQAESQVAKLSDAIGARLTLVCLSSEPQHTLGTARISGQAVRSAANADSLDGALVKDQHLSLLSRLNSATNYQNAAGSILTFLYEYICFLQYRFPKTGLTRDRAGHSDPGSHARTFGGAS